MGAVNFQVNFSTFHGVDPRNITIFFKILKPNFTHFLFFLFIHSNLAEWLRNITVVLQTLNTYIHWLIPVVDKTTHPALHFWLSPPSLFCYCQLEYTSIPHCPETTGLRTKKDHYKCVHIRSSLFCSMSAKTQESDANTVCWRVKEKTGSHHYTDADR